MLTLREDSNNDYVWRPNRKSEVLGRCAIYIYDEDSNGPKRGHIINVRVLGSGPNLLSNENHNKGYGTRMMLELLVVARRSGCKVVTLDVARDNPAAIRVYKKVGFKREKNNPINTQADGWKWRMICTL